MILKTSLFLALLTFLSTFNAGTVSAQYQSDEYRRFTISFNTGMVRADYLNPDSGALRSYGRQLNSGLSLGSSLMYGFTPKFALEARGHLNFFNIPGSGKVDQVGHTSLRGIFFLNQIFNMRSFSSRLAPYVTAGAGVDVVDIVDMDRFGWNIVGGIGSSIYLNEAVDIFMQYDWAGGNKPRLSDGRREFSSYGNLYAGLRIHFGEQGTTHPGWRRPMMRREASGRMLAGADSQVQQQERAFTAVALTEDSTFNMLAAEVHAGPAFFEQEPIINNRIHSYAGMYESQPNENLYNERTPGAENPAGRAEAAATLPPPEPLLSKTLDADEGHYVQLFASRDIRPAIQARGKAVELLEERFGSAENMVFIARKQGVHRVLVGTLRGIIPAIDMVERLQPAFRDAFMITLPGPAHLSEAYQEMEVLNPQSIKL